MGALFGGNPLTGGEDAGFWDAHRYYTQDLPPVLDSDGNINLLRQRTDAIWGDGKISTPILVKPTTKNRGCDEIKKS